MRLAPIEQKLVVPNAVHGLGRCDAEQSEERIVRQPPLERRLLRRAEHIGKHENVHDHLQSRAEQSTSSVSSQQSAVSRQPLSGKHGARGTAS